VTTDSVTLMWASAPNGGTAVRFIVIRDGREIDQVRDASYVDEGLASGTTYLYRVIAVGRDGSRARTGAIEVATASPSTDGGTGGGTSPGSDGCTFEEYVAGEC
jgi:hypothetical protein